MPLRRLRVALFTALVLGVVIYASFKWWLPYHELPPITDNQSR
jgi:hypothetical protein